MPVYLVEQDGYFDRPQLYRDNGSDYKDNCERFAFFCRAVMQSLSALGVPIDVLHCNDWQTGLIPAYLQIEHAHVPFYERIASLYTIHNLAYQGSFWHWDMLLDGLGLEVLQLAPDGVSRSSESAEDRHRVLRRHQYGQSAIRQGDSRGSVGLQLWRVCCGIAATCSAAFSTASTTTSGIRATIALIRANYDVQTWQQGKAQCKASLQQELGLPVEPTPSADRIWSVDWPIKRVGTWWPK